MLPFLITDPNSQKKESFYDMVSLYIDDSQIPISSREYFARGPGPLPPDGKHYAEDLGSYFTFSWAHPLTVGDHVAKVVIATTLPGKTLEYEWHFRIK